MKSGGITRDSRWVHDQVRRMIGRVARRGFEGVTMNNASLANWRLSGYITAEELAKIQRSHPASVIALREALKESGH